mgnify:CR=1 FL=1
MILDERIASSTRLVAELPLCNVYLQNESRFPWLVLVPRQPNLVELIDLSEGLCGPQAPNPKAATLKKRTRDIFFIIISPPFLYFANAIFLFIINYFT